MFLWRTNENYPSVIIKYPPYLVFCSNPFNLSKQTTVTSLMMLLLTYLAVMSNCKLKHKHYFSFLHHIWKHCGQYIQWPSRVDHGDVYDVTWGVWWLLWLFRTDQSLYTVYSKKEWLLETDILSPSCCYQQNLTNQTEHDKIYKMTLVLNEDSD